MLDHLGFSELKYFATHFMMKGKVSKPLTVCVQC